MGGVVASPFRGTLSYLFNRATVGAPPATFQPSNASIVVASGAVAAGVPKLVNLSGGPGLCNWLIVQSDGTAGALVFSLVIDGVQLDTLNVPAGIGVGSIQWLFGNPLNLAGAGGLPVYEDVPYKSQLAVIVTAANNAANPLAFLGLNKRLS